MHALAPSLQQLSQDTVYGIASMRGCLVALPCIAGALLAPTPRVTTTLRQSQAAPERFERADDAERLAKRIETVLARRTSRLIVVLERLVDGHNYSAIFRTCEALGVQHVWVVAPPPGAARFESRSSLRRKAKAERARQYAANDANRRADDQPVRAGSRKDRRRRKAADAWTADDALDAEHAVHGRGAARFLSVRDFASHAEVIAAVRAVPRCELWCSDLGQDASVLADGAPWLRGPLPHRVALVFGTESTGVSNELLAACDRRVYVPQHGFADSLNVGVAAALATSHVLKLVGGGGDLLETTDWVPDAPDELRRKWAGVLCRDEAQLAAVRAAGGEVAVLDDLRRAPEFRGHTGRPTKLTRRAEFRKRRALESES